MNTGSVLDFIPPSSNTGGKTSFHEGITLDASLKTDWFRVILDTPKHNLNIPSRYDFDSKQPSSSNTINDLIAYLQTYVPNYHHINPIKGRFNYQYAQKFINRDLETATSLFYGGNNGTILAEASGKHAEPFRDLITDLYECRATRRDICMDMELNASIHDVHATLEEITSQRWYVTDKGNGVTLENSPKRDGKEYFIRVYEKGAQLNIPNSNWVRFEAEIKIDRKKIPERKYIAHCTEHQALELDAQSTIVFNYFSQSKLVQTMLEPTEKELRETSLATLLKHVNKQYRSFFIKLLAHHDGNTNAMFFSLIRGELSNLQHNYTPLADLSVNYNRS